MSNTHDIKRAVAADAEGFAAWLFPAGRRKGSKSYVGDIAGNPGESLVINLDGKFAGGYRDWATGEAGDCVALVMAVRGMDFVPAVRILRERYGLRTPLGPPIRHRKAARLSGAPQTVPTPAALEPEMPKLPKLERGTQEDMLRLSESRNLLLAAVELASERGLLWFFNSKEGRAWLITDSARRNAQARRLDGEPWAWNGKKAWTIGGSSAKWPIGLPESVPFPAIALVEGGPDFVAALHHAIVSGVEAYIAPVCIAGATMSILAECLPAFQGKRVRVFVHNDAEGLKAAKRWAAQLRGVGAQVDGYSFDGLDRADGAAVADLCDLASIGADSWEANREIVEACMSFVTERRVAKWPA